MMEINQIISEAGCLPGTIHGLQRVTWLIVTMISIPFDANTDIDDRLDIRSYFDFRVKIPKYLISGNTFAKILMVSEVKQ